jgi:O-antigen/teichoic acid export membrane protein
VAFRLGAVPVGFGYSVLISRSLEPTGRGTLVLAILVTTMATTLFGSLGVAVTRRVSSATDDTAGHALVQGLLLAICSGAALTVVLASSLRAWAPRGDTIDVIAFGTTPLLVHQVVSGALLGTGRLRTWNVLQIGLQVGNLTFTTLFVLALGWGLRGAAFSWVTGNAAIAAVGLGFTRRQWTHALSGTRNWRELLDLYGYGLKIGLAGIISLINYRVELFLLEAWQGLRAVGIYSVAVSLAELLWLVSTAVATAALPNLLAAPTDAGAAAVAARVARLSVLLCGFLGLGLAIAAVPLVPWVFGNSFQGARWALLALLPGVLAFAPASILAHLLTVRLGSTRVPVVGAAISASITAVTAVILIPWLGMRGAAVASSLGYVVAMAFSINRVAHLTGLRARSFLPRLTDLADLAGFLRSILAQSAAAVPTVVSTDGTF